MAQSFISDFRMKRRDFIISLVMATIGQGFGTVHALAEKMIGEGTNTSDLLVGDNWKNNRIQMETIVSEKDACPVPDDVGALIRGKGNMVKPADQSVCLAPLVNKSPHVQADEYRTKMRTFKEPHPDDCYVSSDQRPLLKECVERLKRIYRTVGHTNFYLLGIDDALKLARGYQRIGSFTRAEIKYLESTFHEDAVSYGFYGKKQITDFTYQIPRKQVTKIPHTANYLYNGSPVALYQRLHRDIGSTATLTSGVRGIIKQSYLFLRKVQLSQGNLSLASRSIAPPGYSYHGIGDFDVGQVGLGPDNFSARFIHSKVFKNLLSLDYVCLRYTEDNPFGVRFEPWHVMVNLSG